MPSNDDAVAEMPDIAVTPKEWAILREILARYAPGRKAWAYGSRATRYRLKQYSDLDIALSDEPIRRIGDWSLEDALEEAPLPFKCEVVVLPRLDAAFRSRIEPDFVELKFEYANVL
jgi:hypothetical protein